MYQVEVELLDNQLIIPGYATQRAAIKAARRILRTGCELFRDEPPGGRVLVLVGPDGIFEVRVRPQPDDEPDGPAEADGRTIGFPPLSILPSPRPA